MCMYFYLYSNGLESPGFTTPPPIIIAVIKGGLDSTSQIYEIVEFLYYSIDRGISSTGNRNNSMYNFILFYSH